MPFCFWTDSLVTANAFSFLCTFFFEKKVRKKAIQEARPPEKPPVKVQGGASLPRQIYQSKGGSAARILKVFLIVRSFCACGDGAQQLPSSLRKVAFSKENDGRSLQGETCRNHQGGNFPQTPFIYLYVLSFLKRKYERKQFRRHVLLKNHL